MKNLILVRHWSMLSKLLIAGMCLMSFSCKQKETESTTPQPEPIKKLTGIWSAPETAPYFKVLALYDDNTFVMLEWSDVGGYKYRGKYRLDDMSIDLSPNGYDPSSAYRLSKLPEPERFCYHMEEGKIQWMQSDSEARFKMYLCAGLDDIDQWLVYIINSESFRNRVRRYRYVKK